MGMKTAADELVIGSYAPQTEPRPSSSRGTTGSRPQRRCTAAPTPRATGSSTATAGRTSSDDHPVKVTK